MPRHHIRTQRTINAIEEVITERRRQISLQDEGRFKFTLSDSGLSDSQRLVCIMEEVGEVARNILTRDGLAKDGDTSDLDLRKELSQIAALSVAWMERL